MKKPKTDRIKLIAIATKKNSYFSFLMSVVVSYTKYMYLQLLIRYILKFHRNLYLKKVFISVVIRVL